MGMVNKALGVYKRYGLKGFAVKLNEKIQSPVRDYTKNVARYLPTAEELEQQRNITFAYEPRISIIVPAYETPELFLTQLLDALMNQTYDNWELCIADGSTTNRVEKVIQIYQKRIADSKNKIDESNQLVQRKEKRYSIQYKRLERNNGISENTNEGLPLATGDYIGFMDHDDVLELNALFEMVKMINEYPSVEVIYSDEDKVSHDLSKHMQPHFKSDFNLELLRDNNYICHFLVISKEMLGKVKGFRKEYDGSQDYDFVLRLVEQAKCVKHVPKILYHWRMHAASTAGDSDSKTYTFDAGQQAVQDHLKRMDISAEVEKRIEVGCFHVKYNAATSYDASNGEPQIVLSKAEYVKPAGDTWKEELYSYASQKDVGIVAGKTYDRSGKVVQNGLLYTMDGSVYPVFTGLKRGYKGYCRRAVLAQEMSGVSLDFAMISKEAYDKVGGINEALPSPYKDMDFCLRLKEAGYRVIQDPYAEAVVEAVEKKKSTVDNSIKSNKSCGKESILPIKEVMSEEMARIYLKKKYASWFEKTDCCYNPNFSQNGQTFQL